MKCGARMPGGALAIALAALYGCSADSQDAVDAGSAGANSGAPGGAAADGGAIDDGASTDGNGAGDGAVANDGGGGCPSATSGIMAARAADFLNILSLQGHASDGSPPYLNASQFVSDAKFVGARHVRDGLNASDTGLASLRALAQAGISLVAGTPYGTLVIDDLLATIHTWQGWAAGAVYAIESVNEPELATITYGGATGGSSNDSWLPVAQFTADYYKAVKADGALTHVPFFGVSRVGAETDNAGLQFLTVPTPAPNGVLLASGAALGDYFTQHLYPMTIQYLQGGIQGSAQTMDPVAGDQFVTDLHWNAVETFHAGYSGYASDQAASPIPKVITEFGYSTTATSAGGSQVDEATQAKDLLTGLLNAWKKGYALVSIYETYEGGDGFGIFASPGVPKMAATYLHNFTTALADDGAGARTFAPGALGVTLSGLPSSASSVLFQTSGCNFKLVVWNNATNWDIGKGAPVTVAPVTVTATFGAPVAVKVYDASKGTTPIQTAMNATTAIVSLADAPIVLDIQ